MNRVLRGLILFACLGVFTAQTQAPANPQPPAGLESDWDIAVVLQQVSAHAAHLIPALSRADASLWASKGAPAAYAAQLESSKEQAQALADGAKALAANPETLPAELQLVFREQSLEATLASVAEAMRKYQSPQLAQELVAVTAEGGADRDRLESYVVNLAAEREKEYQVMDQEAQRCRAAVLAPAGAAKKKK